MILLRAASTNTNKSIYTKKDNIFILINETNALKFV